MPDYDGKILSSPDCITTRGPLINNDGVYSVGNPIRYTLGPEYTEHYPTDGSPRTFYTTVRVKWEDKDAFIASVLPDVYLGSALLDQTIRLDPYITDTNGVDIRSQGRNNYHRRACHRLPPEVHPLRPHVYAVDAVVIRGEGYIDRQNREPGAWPRFKTRSRAFAWPQPELEDQIEDGTVLTTDPDAFAETFGGYAYIGVTWKDLPYTVLTSETYTATNDEINSNDYSEFYRYVMVKPSPKGSHLPIPSLSGVFITDAGATLRAGASNLPVKLAEAQPVFIPAVSFAVVWKMVPRVPRAAYLLQGFCNETPMEFDRALFDQPIDVGTLCYMGPELSDPYRTVTGQRVVDITYNFGYRPSGNGTYRGWNTGWCPTVRDFRRLVFGDVTADDRITTSSGKVITKPITDADPTVDQAPRRTTKEGCTYPFAILENLFRFTAPPRVEPTT